jgi:NTP pyrophosphatase (non-canonical NTP hydrolase)
MEGLVVASIQTSVLRMAHHVGVLAACPVHHCPLWLENAERSITSLLGDILTIAAWAGVDVFAACFRKMELNEKKYQKDLCSEKVRTFSNWLWTTRGCPLIFFCALTGAALQPLFTQIVKYTSLSPTTGVEKHNQKIVCATNSPGPMAKTYGAMLLSVQEQSFAFVKERGWEHLDTQKSLCLALVSEIGELADLVAWADCKHGFASDTYPDFLNKLAQELADVTIYLVRYARKGDVDLGNAVSLMQKHGVEIGGWST